jgi:hypothetical protein
MLVLWNFTYIRKGNKNTAACAAVHSPAHWGCVPTNTVGSGRVGSGRVQSSVTHRVRESAHHPGWVQYDLQSQGKYTPPESSSIWFTDSGKCTLPGSSPIWLTESGEVHTVRVESNLTHRVRESAHHPGWVQYDLQSQGKYTPPGLSPIWFTESGKCTLPVSSPI